MDHTDGDDKTITQDEGSPPVPSPDPVTPPSQPDCGEDASPAASTEPAVDEPPIEDKEESVEVLRETEATTEGEVVPNTAPEPPSQVSEGPPPDVTAHDSQDTPSETPSHGGSEDTLPATTTTASDAQPDVPTAPDAPSDCSHSTTSIAASTPHPPGSTAPSSTRTSLTDAPGTSKPPGILRASTLPRSASLTAVTFAPLPPTEPRRRASHMQLGVAARSRMLAARRMRLVDPDTGEQLHVVDAAMAQHAGQYGYYAYPGDDEPEDPYRRPRRPRAGPPPGAAPPDDDDATPEEDALVALGKMVRGGARALWRKMSKGGGPRDDAAEGAAARPVLRRSQSEPGPAREERGTESVSSDEGVTLRVEFHEPRHCFDENAKSAPADPSTPAPPAATATPPKGGSSPRKEEEGRVWEEEVDGDIQKRMQAAAREKEKERGKGKLIGRLASCAPLKASKPKSR